MGKIRKDRGKERRREKGGEEGTGTGRMAKKFLEKLDARQSLTVAHPDIPLAAS